MADFGTATALLWPIGGLMSTTAGLFLVAYKRIIFVEIAVA